MLESPTVLIKITPGQGAHYRLTEVSPIDLFDDEPRFLVVAKHMQVCVTSLHCQANAI